MNDLAMGPLLARPKREVDVAGEKWVFRCGVASCPEILLTARRAHIWHHILTYGYTKRHDGTFAKSQRPANRSEIGRLQNSHEREGNLETLAMLAERQAEFQAQDNEFEAERTTKLMTDFEKVVLDKDRQGREFQSGLFILDEAFPVTVMCGRCGRLSKIERGRFSA
jgi:hypothetical protein